MQARERENEQFAEFQRWWDSLTLTRQQEINNRWKETLNVEEKKSLNRIVELHPDFDIYSLRA